MEYDNVKDVTFHHDKFLLIEYMIQDACMTTAYNLDQIVYYEIMD